MVNRAIITPHRIIGIDPGSHVIGYAILENKKELPLNPKDFAIIAAGAITAKESLSLIERIGYLHEAIFELAADYKPDCCIIEKSFIGINAGSSLRLGEARGSLMSAIHRLRVPIHEVTPTQVKKMVTGRGGATKKDVAFCLKALLGFELGSLPFDVSDAVAIALYHGMTYASSKVARPQNSLQSCHL